METLSNLNKIYRKASCPFGIKAIELLNREKIAFEDHIFSSKDEELEFKNKHHVKTTPQVFMDGKNIGGYSDLAKIYGEITPKDEKKTYIPVMAVFSTTAFMAIASSTGFTGFMGFSLCVLALLKLMDIHSFVKGFKEYDHITQIFPTYGKAYPFLELFTGLGFISSFSPLLTGVISTFVGFAGGASIIKTVYIDKKDLNCACVGGNQNVPLGAISFTENAMMAIMGLYLIFTL